MNDTTLAAVPAEAAPSEAKPRWWQITVTDPGCRTDVRLGGLLVMGSVFLWLFAGPALSAKGLILGGLLLLWGIPAQAIQARSGRPGYPWKMGLAFAVLGLAMIPDLRYREVPGGPIGVQIMAPALAIAGLWVLAWWPVARRKPVEDAA